MPGTKNRWSGRMGWKSKRTAPRTAYYRARLQPKPRVMKLLPGQKKITEFFKTVDRHLRIIKARRASCK